MTGEATIVEWRPGHQLWRHTRELMVKRFAEIALLAGGEVYVVDLHVDTQPWDDIRNAAIEVRWDTETHLAERRGRWRPHPELLKHDPLAADQVPWDWVAFRGGGDEGALWHPRADPEGHALLGDYARALGLSYTDAELARAQDDPDLEVELGERQTMLGQALQAGLPPLVLALHHDGEIARIFGRPIPITFSSRDPHEPAWEWGRDANPPELYAQFGPAQERYWSPG
jgi:hypothetical protein